MSSSFKAPSRMKDPLSLKVPQNPKYKDVRPTIDTGASMTKYWENIREIKANYKYKQGEIFKRIKVTSLVGLMIKVAEMKEAHDEERRRETSTADGSATREDSGSASSANPAPPEAASAGCASPEINSAQSLSAPVVATQFPSPQLLPPRFSARASSVSASSSRPTSARSSSILGAAPYANNNIFLPPPPPAPTMSTRSRSKRSEPVSASSATPFFPHPSALRKSVDSECSSFARPASSRASSSLQGLIGGIGERTTSTELLNENKENTASTGLDPPYLLLDIREEDQFNAGHLRTAKNFPSSRLSRAFQFASKELQSFRNSEGKIIVVYDEDETMAPRAATILVERGYDNVYMLSGGINVAEKFFPGGLYVKPGDKSSQAGAAPPLSPTLSLEEIGKLQPRLGEASLAKSPAHRPSAKSSFDRRRTQLIGSQFKQKKAAGPNPNCLNI